ncbi:MAG: PorP/SprF family type IX secretion system membrane protein [Bacteroidetes bacterium]|nr:PorP/SprF family type IX secretion system membrane protein [Bacteroidota bacterium]
MKKYLVAIIFFCTMQIFAQDVHLSQFYTAQQNLNPALAGFYNGEYRIAGNYRSQWREIGDPITTAVIAFDKKFHFYSDEIDGGIIVVKDQFSGFNQNTNKIFLTGSYKKLWKYNEIRAGIQAGIVLKSTDLKTQTFPNQWVYETGIFDQNLSNGENDISQSQNFIDVNFGVAWSKTFTKFKPTLGLSLFHVNRPKDTYFNTPTERLRMRQVVHGEAVIDLNGPVSIEPKLLYMWTTKAQDALIGSNVKYHFKDSKVKNVYAGVLYRDGFGRNSDAVIPIVGLTYNRFDVGFSYDVNISTLSDYSARKSTLEFSLIYTAPLFSPKNLSIPCDRY